MYTAIFVETMSAQFRLVPTTVSFRECFYNYFLITQNSTILAEYNRFSIRYNIFFKYLRGLQTARQVLGSVINHTLSSDCKLDLLQLTHCSLCAGTTVRPCPNHCKNVIRGCLVELKEFGDVYSDFHKTLKRTKIVLEEYDPFAVLGIFQTNLLNFAFVVAGNVTSISSDVRELMLS